MKKIIIASCIALFAATGVAFARTDESSEVGKIKDSREIPELSPALMETDDIDEVDDADDVDEMDAVDDIDDMDVDEIDDEVDDIDEDTDDQGKADEHRSEVAKFVQTLLGASARMGGIGEEVRKIASEQASSTEKVASAVEKVEKREKWKTFLIGSDYENLGEIRSELVTTKNRLQRLSREVEKMASSTEKVAVTTEIASLEQEEARIEAFVESNESKFSIFGWLVRLFQE